MKPDPKPRKDGLCVVCLRPRRVPRGVWAREAAELDSFCSNTCCRAYHNCPLPDARLAYADTSCYLNEWHEEQAAAKKARRAAA